MLEYFYRLSILSTILDALVNHNIRFRSLLSFGKKSIVSRHYVLVNDFLSNFITLPPSPSTETAVEATAIDDPCCYNISPTAINNHNHPHRRHRLRRRRSYHQDHHSSSTPSPSASPPVSSCHAPPSATSNLSTSAPPSSRSNVLIGLDQFFTSLLMKMEVLSVQNHHLQQQFGVIGSTKVKKDWTSPLTPPTPAAVTASSSPSSTTSTNNQHNFHFPLHSPIEHFDVVDGIKPPQQNDSPQHYYSATNSATHPQFGPAHSIAMETAAATTAPPKSGIEGRSDAHYAYNNNLLYCVPNGPATGSAPIGRGETTSYHHHHHHHHHHHYPTTSSNAPSAYPPSPASSNLSTPTEATEHYGIGGHEYDDIDATAVNELSQRLQAELRAAKSRHLSCTEVSLPWDLTPRIAADMIKTSEREPCGVRGCAIFIDFEDETGSARRIASFKIDPNTVSTFELFLTLKQDKGG